MKFFERNEMMRYLTRPATPKTLPQDAGNRGLELTTEERMGFKDAGAVIKPFNNKQREIAKTVYELKDSEIDTWQKNPDNRIKVYRIVKGITTKETKATGIKPNDPNRIIVKAPRSSEKVSDVIFPNKKIEKNFIKDVKKKFSSPVSASEITFASLAEEYPISEKQAGRAVRFLKDKLDLEYPPGTPTKEYYSAEAIKERYGDVTSRKMEEKIVKAKTPVLKELDLRKKIDLAHRVSKRHMNRLGIQFNTELVGMDSRLINQIIVKPSESVLKNLFNKQYNLFNIAKKSGVTEDISKKLEDVNSKIIDEVNKTSGRLVGVVVDPKTLDVSFHGIKNKLSLDSKAIDLKDLEKMSLEKQADYLSKIVPKAVNAEVSRGFIPNDFAEILKDPNRQKSILKYAEATKDSELVKGVKEIFKNPTSTKSLKLYSGFAMLEDIADPALKRLEPFFKGGLDFAKTAIKSPLAKGVGKFGLGEIAAAPLFSALDYGAGLEPSEIALNIPTLGLGTTAKDYGTAVLNLPKKQQERLGEIFSQETTLPEVDEDIVKNISKTYEDLEKKRAKVAESRIQPLGSTEEPFIPLEPLINKQEVKDDLYIPSLPKKNLAEKEGVLNLAIGGRVGFKDGPKDPSKRKFIKGAGITGAAIGILNLAPDLFKALKKTKTPIKILPKVTGMPDWFPSLVAKIEKEGKYMNKDIGLEDNLKIKQLTIPSKTGKGGDEIYTMIQHSNGDIVIEANTKGGAFNAPFELHYKPPKSDIDVTTGTPIKEPGEFNVMENRPRSTAASHHDSDYEIDYDLVSYNQAISDVERAERVATGKRIDPRRVQEREAARKYVEENPYDDIVNRYGDYNYKDVDYE